MPTTMKRQSLLLLFLLLAGMVRSQAPTVDGDTITISVLTCEPHDEVYSLYGHTALRFRSTSGKMDWAANYGVFDYDTPNFVMRFALGRTDYILGVFPFEDFKREYDSYGSAMHEQVLNLTKGEKERIYEAMYHNALPENREYRYNYFYDNCTTRARNLVLANIDGHIDWHRDMSAHEESYRDIVHRYNAANPWSRFGCDLLLGIGADRAISAEEAQFLPDNLQNDLNAAEVVAPDGRRRALVSRTSVIRPHNPPMKGGSFPLRPRTCALLVLIASIAVTLWQWRKGNRWAWPFDAFLMLLSGLPGLVLTFMVLSEHPTVRVNLQWLILNPLPLFVGWHALCRQRKYQRHWLWPTWTTLLLLGSIGAIAQQYAEGVLVLATAMLIRTLWHTQQQRDWQPKSQSLSEKKKTKHGKKVTDK